MDSDDDYIPASQFEVVEPDSSDAKASKVLSEKTNHSEEITMQVKSSGKGKGPVQDVEASASDAKENMLTESIEDEHGTLIAWVKNEKSSSDEEDDGSKARMDPRPFKELYLPAELDKYQREANKRLKNPDYDAKFLEWKYGKERWAWMRASYYAPMRPKTIPPCPSLVEIEKEEKAAAKRKADGDVVPSTSRDASALDVASQPSQDAKRCKCEDDGDK